MPFRLKMLYLGIAVAVALCLQAPVPLEAQPSARVKSHEVYAYTLKHQPVHEALALVRPLLSSVGTVEEQPRSNTLVIRDARSTIEQIVPVLEAFDHPPQDLRFEIKIVRAGPRGPEVSPPLPPTDAADELPAELVAKLRELLRYDNYQVLAKAEVSSKEGEEVTYSLGQSYSVRFRPGTVLAGAAGQRLKLEGFRVIKQLPNPANKGRHLEPRELFHATLNLWIDRPFNLVLTQDESSQEALLVAISFRRESDP